MPSASCPLFYECDSPFFTPICMSSTESDSVFFRASINGSTCEAAPPQPFVTETLLLDTHDDVEDGIAGPVTTIQALDSRQSFLITVEGALSLWPASAWGPPPILICGTPEIAPQFPSPDVTNGWVGLDAEYDFSVPLPPNSDCNDLPSQGYPAHPGRFRIDSGSGFGHLEPQGGTPTQPWPNHLYRYLIQGENAPVSFAWFDSATTDNYGILRIIVSQQEPTDTHLVLIQHGFALLPNVPNPFNPSTEIRYELPQACDVDVSVYDVRGRLIRRIFAGAQTAGYHALRWNGRRDDGAVAGSGVYFARVLTPVGQGTRRVTLVK